MQLCSSLSILWHCLSLGLEWKLTFSSPVATAEFSKFAGILSAAHSQHHLLGFEIAQLEFYHLHSLHLQWLVIRHTLHSRMSGSRWVVTPSRLSGSWRSFLYNYSVYSCHLLLISSAPGRPILFQSLIVPIFAWNAPLVSLIFLKRSLVFPILLFSSISLHWSPRKAFLSLLAILWNSAIRWVYLSFSPLHFSFCSFPSYL